MGIVSNHPGGNANSKSGGSQINLTEVGSSGEDKWAQYLARNPIVRPQDLEAQTATGSRHQSHAPTGYDESLAPTNRPQAPRAGYAKLAPRMPVATQPVNYDEVDDRNPKIKPGPKATKPRRRKNGKLRMGLFVGGLLALSVGSLAAAYYSVIGGGGTEIAGSSHYAGQLPAQPSPTVNVTPQATTEAEQAVTEPLPVPQTLPQQQQAASLTPQPVQVLPTTQDTDTQTAKEQAPAVGAVSETEAVNVQPPAAEKVSETETAVVQPPAAEKVSESEAAVELPPAIETASVQPVAVETEPKPAVTEQVEVATNQVIVPAAGTVQNKVQSAVPESAASVETEEARQEMFKSFLTYLESQKVGGTLDDRRKQVAFDTFLDWSVEADKAN